MAHFNYSAASPHSHFLIFGCSYFAVAALFSCTFARPQTHLSSYCDTAGPHNVCCGLFDYSGPREDLPRGVTIAATAPASPRNTTIRIRKVTSFIALLPRQHFIKRSRDACGLRLRAWLAPHWRTTRLIFCVMHRTFRATLRLWHPRHSQVHELTREPSLCIAGRRHRRSGGITGNWKGSNKALQKAGIDSCSHDLP